MGEIDYLRAEESRLVDEVLELRRRLALIKDILAQIARETNCDRITVLAKSGMKI